MTDPQPTLEQEDPALAEIEKNHNNESGEELIDPQELREKLMSRFPAMEREAMNSMSYWLPVLMQMQMRIPKTILVHTGGVDMIELLNGRKPAGFDDFMGRLKLSAAEIGYPLFLRTGMTSDKHDWENTCYVKNKQALEKHVMNLVESSVMANISGYPFDYSFWAVRELIPAPDGGFTYFNGNMPIRKEFRYFINNKDIVCSHPYWPEAVFENAGEEALKELREMNTLTPEEKIDLDLMARYIAQHFDGHWSIDFLAGRQGRWYVTDMAVGERSYHIEDCPNAPEQPVEETHESLEQSESIAEEEAKDNSHDNEQVSESV